VGQVLFDREPLCKNTSETEIVRRLLSHLPAFDPESKEATAVIETPKGSPNKYKFDEAGGFFRLNMVLPKGSYFPFDFGFISSTRGADGDPLDVLVLMDDPAPVGCIITVRLIGAIEAEQREKDGKWERNDRLLAVACKSHLHLHVQDLDDLRPNLLDEVEAFFTFYAGQRGKTFKPLRRVGRKKADKLLQHGMSAFEQQPKPE
jgi:inorganic pyrophosphatase